jgi:hypothetical protein
MVELFGIAMAPIRVARRVRHFQRGNGGAGTMVIDPPIAGADSATTQINPHHAQRRRTDSLERLALCLDVALCAGFRLPA